MLNRMRNRLNEDGFTLIELMVVVLIIAILVAIAIPTFLGQRETAQDRAAQSNLRNALATEKPSTRMIRPTRPQPRISAPSSQASTGQLTTPPTVVCCRRFTLQQVPCAWCPSPPAEPSSGSMSIHSRQPFTAPVPQLRRMKQLALLAPAGSS